MHFKPYVRGVDSASKILCRLSSPMNAHTTFKVVEFSCFYLSASFDLDWKMAFVEVCLDLVIAFIFGCSQYCIHQ